MGRVVAQRLSELWNQRVVVDSRVGAGGSIGTEFVAQSAPDGDTLVLGNSASHGAKVLLSSAPLLAGQLFKLVADGVTRLSGSVPTVAELPRDGRVRALAMASGSRPALAPTAPTRAEAGHAGVTMGSWDGPFAPAGTPAAVAATINADLRRTFVNAEMARRMGELGFDIGLSSPEDLGAYVAAEMVRIGRLIAAARITG